VEKIKPKPVHGPAKVLRSSMILKYRSNENTPSVARSLGGAALLSCGLVIAFSSFVVLLMTLTVVAVPVVMALIGVAAGVLIAALGGCFLTGGNNGRQ
jgi:hypothetical protein